MKGKFVIGFWIVCAVVLLFGFVVFRGAPYVPSLPKEVRRAITELYPLGQNDFLVDIGSGDGTILRMASKAHAHAVGYELNPILVIISRILSWRDKNVSVHLADFWRVNLPEVTTVVYVFAVERDAKKLTQKFQFEANRLRRPLAVISYGSKLRVTPERELGAHQLYYFAPLQSEKA